MLFLAVDDAPGQADVSVACSLVKVTLLCCFKAAGALIHHIVHASDAAEIQTVAKDPVYADIAYHEHAELAFSLSFRPHQPRQQLLIIAVHLNDRQSSNSLPLLKHQAFGNSTLVLMY